MSYAELFCQSNFSFLTGASHAEELVLQAAFYRYHAIAITDECSVAGVVKAHATIEQHKLDIKQIVGSMFWLNEECQIVLLCPAVKLMLRCAVSSLMQDDAAKKAVISFLSGI